MPAPHSDPQYAFLRDLLSGARKGAGVTQAELARRLGVSQQVVSLIEGGQRRIDVVEFYAWAIALERSPAELYAEVIAQLSS